MAERFQPSEDDELAEILRRAVRKDAASAADLRERLLAAAGELGISPEAVVEAETEYRQEAGRARELALYHQQQREGFRVHLVTYALTNLFLAAINLMTYKDDHEIWFPIVLLAWGIGFGIHAYTAYRKVGWDDEEFQKWRELRASKDSSD